MSNKVYIGIIAALLGIVIYLAIKVNDQQEKIVYIDKEKNAIMDEREVLEVELEQMKMSYDTLEVDNEEMAAKIAEQQDELAALIKKAKNKDYDISKLKKEAETLRTIMKGYIHQIDSLQRANEQLYAEKEAEAARANNAESRSRELEGDLNSTKEIVNKGSVLSTGEFKNTGIIVRGSGKEVETDRANRSDMVKSCFTVRKNPIVKAGTKKIYLRIVGPDGKVLPGKDGGSITVNGASEQYSVTREIDYNNQDTDVCVYYTSQAELKKGNYKIFVYDGANLIGSSDLSLK